MHAARIASEHGVAGCDDILPAIERLSWAARGELVPLAADHPCDGLTANQCAAYFVANPEDLLVPTKAGGQLRAEFIDTDARCSDGTPPLAYFRPSRAGSHEDDWLFFFHGTNLACRHFVDRGGRTLTPGGELCWAGYGPGGIHTPVGARDEIRKGGMLNPNLAGNPFADWNVVYLLQCSNDLASGDVAPTVTLTGQPDQVGELVAPVPANGAQIVRDLFAHFAGVSRPVPQRDLSSASTVVLAGTSGGGLAMAMNLDRFAAEVAMHAAGAAVVGVVDAYMPPSTMVLEAGFDGGTPCPSVFEADCDPAHFDVPNAGVDIGSGLGFDVSAYERFDPATPVGTQASGFVREWFEGWNSTLDTSCAAFHSAPTDGSCYDHQHVLLHHTQTPVFISDSSVDPGKLTTPLSMLSAATPSACFATLIPGDPEAGARLYSSRHRAQAASAGLNRDNVGGGAHGDSHGAGPVGVFVAEVGAHMFLPDDCRSGALALGTDAKNAVTVLEAIEDWIDGDPVLLVEGVRAVQRFDRAVCPEDALAARCDTMAHR